MKYFSPSYKTDMPYTSFYRNILYKNIEGEICELFTNILRINLRLRIY